MYRLICKEEDVTHGQRMLLNKIDKRKFMEFCRDTNLNFNYTYKIGIGGITPPSTTVYILRNIIHPVLWYYKESETIPQLKKYKNTTKEVWDYEKSLGFYILKKEAKKTTLKNWALSNGFSHSAMWFIVSGKRSPSYAKIKELRDIIYPADWFYPKK